MRDFDKFVRSLADEDRATMIKNLTAADAAAYRAAHSGSQDKRYEARKRSERFGRIIYFLRHGSHSDSATNADLALCEFLVEKLKAKGQ
jgi:hypothetical protein